MGWKTLCSVIHSSARIKDSADHITTMAPEEKEKKKKEKRKFFMPPSKFCSITFSPFNQLCYKHVHL